jgi:multiple sugar transport system substrate-binding protein
MVQLRGMTWNHPRGVLPLKAAAAEFKKQYPEVDISWDARSLHDFEAFPLEILAETYDIIMIDHPHIGSAVERNILVPLNEWLPEAYLEDQRVNSVGGSFQSYTWKEKQWALAADAAAQVSVYRDDLLRMYSLPVPSTWEEVRRLGKELSRGKLALPLAPVHAFASFVTLSAQLSGGQFWNDGSDLQPDIGAAAIAALQELVPYLHESSFTSDPITMSDLMASTDDIAYVPLMYGYSNYARHGFAPRILHYCDIPSDTDIPSGSMIGGVGISVSSRCRNLPLAMEFVQLVAGGPFQRTAYVQSGGQPGHRSAWTDEGANRLSNQFFQGTLRTLDHGYMRPRFDGYIAFQEHAGAMLREALLSGHANPTQLIRELNGLLKQEQGQNIRKSS